MLEIILLIWLVFFVLIVTVLSFSDIPVHWGPTGPVMSRRSRVVFCAAVWSMFGVILAGVIGSAWLPWILRIFFACVVCTFITFALDKRAPSSDPSPHGIDDDVNEK